MCIGDEKLRGLIPNLKKFVSVKHFASKENIFTVLQTLTSG